MAWERDEALFEQLCAGGSEGACGRVRTIASRYYAAPPRMLCPEPGEPFWGFPPPPEGVALQACEGCGIELDLARRRSVRDFCAREYKTAAVRWVAHRQLCINSGWRCATREAAAGRDRLGTAPQPRAARGMQPFVAGALLGALAGRIVKA